MDQFNAQYHLPGLFEFYALYRLFLPLFFEHREYFYDWCGIGSIYGAPEGCLWGGGRVSCGDCDPCDPRCNALCRLFESSGENGIIVHSDLLAEHVRQHYPGLYLVSSTTKVLTDFSAFRQELARPEFRYVVPDFRLNPALEQLRALSPQEKAKVEFLCNECCRFGCPDRRACYEAVSRKNLGEPGPEHRCTAPDAAQGYRFSRAMENPGFLGVGDIRDTRLPMGFSEFKLEGRGLGSAMVLEFLLYYMTKPEYQLRVREAIYLDAMLDLF